MYLYLYLHFVPVGSAHSQENHQFQVVYACEIAPQQPFGEKTPERGRINTLEAVISPPSGREEDTFRSLIGFCQSLQSRGQERRLHRGGNRRLSASRLSCVCRQCHQHRVCEVKVDSRFGFRHKNRRNAETTEQTPATISPHQADPSIPRRHAAASLAAERS